MQMSRTALRMDRSHKRRRPLTGFNLVSLMDIFTILVFFLLVNSSDVEVLSSNKAVQLPESIADKKPKETLVILVNENDILVQGRKVADVKTVNGQSEIIIANLKNELTRQANREISRKDNSKPFNGQITIMGDKEVPFSLLKKIMATCAKSRYGKISLAVMHKEGNKS